MAIDFTESELRKFAPKMADNYRETLLASKDLLAHYGILDNGKRFSHFLGQFGGETDGGRILRESLYYTTVSAIRNAWRARAAKYSDAWINTNLLKKPLQLGDWAYGGRMGNRRGTSDGYDFRGGGWLQTTGRENVLDYCQKCSVEIRSDILDDYKDTLLFACAEWKDSGCNALADRDDIMGISKAINTGSATSGIVPNGMEHRRAWFARAKTIWWNAPTDEAVVEPEVPLAVPENHPVDETPPIEREPPPPPLPEPVQVAPQPAQVVPGPLPEPVHIAPAETADEAPGGFLSERSFSKVNALADQGSRLAQVVQRVKRAIWGLFGGGAVASQLVDLEHGNAGIIKSLIAGHPFLALGLALGTGLGVAYLVVKFGFERYFITASDGGRYNPRVRP